MRNPLFHGVGGVLSADIAVPDHERELGFYSRVLTTGPATCKASEQVVQSGVESADDCRWRSIGAGQDSACTITNTVFFEGVPTLGRQGLALLVLLVGGVGCVGLRRFV